MPHNKSSLTVICHDSRMQSWIPCAQALDCNDFHLTYSKWNILSMCSHMCVYLYTVCKCVCMGVQDWTCFQVHKQLRKTSAGEDPWQQMTHRLHVDLRCLKQAARKGKFHRLQTIIQQQQTLQPLDSVRCGMSRSEGVDREQEQHGWQLCKWRLQQTGHLRCGGWGHREVTVLS